MAAVKSQGVPENNAVAIFWGKSVQPNEQTQQTTPILISLMLTTM